MQGFRRYLKVVIVCVVSLLIITACGIKRTGEVMVLPTRVQFPTLSPTSEASVNTVMMRGSISPTPTLTMMTSESGRRALPASWTPTPSPTSTLTPTITVTPSPTKTHTPTRTPEPTLTPTPTPEGRVSVSDFAVQLYQTGLEEGNDPGVFSTVGDCITAIYPFLIGFDTGDYNLGEFDHLENTIDNYDGAFISTSQASGNNFTTATVLDPMWASDRMCEADETPLACEYRVNNPSVAVIMLGTNDVARFSEEMYRTFLIEIIEYTIDENIVPVLTTFPTLPRYYATQSESFNEVVVEVAEQYDIPLIDWRDSVAELPNFGMNFDGLHPSDRGDRYIDFTGEQDEYGMTLRNLLTIQMLDSILNAE